METIISKSAEDIYEFIGSGYGFNGTKEAAIKLLNEKITEVARYYSDKAFCAGRSKQSWESFCNKSFKNHNPIKK